MSGSWRIQKGFGRPHDHQGAGTWTTYLEDRDPTYAGHFWYERIGTKR